MILFTATQKPLYKTHNISQPHAEEHLTAVPQKIPTSISFTPSDEAKKFSDFPQKPE